MGAGIQVPPNAVRVLDHYGLVPNLEAAGAIRVEKLGLLRYSDGQVITVQPGDEWRRRQFGHSWLCVSPSFLSLGLGMVLMWLV